MNTYQTTLLKRLALAGLIGLFSSAALADHHAEGDEEMKQEQVMPEDSGVDSSNDSAKAEGEDGAIPGGEIVKDGGVDSNHAPSDDASASDSQSALDEGDLVEDSGVDSANEPENDV
ncbi:MULTISPECIES: hypothetical protein [Halomonas]|uniref:Uncharacterized protein n=3 Tax=Halomonas TaxID=2745 RepID=A0AAU7KFD5_9GAMM|nr:MULTISPECIES: hypothetical protein [Halomonas]MBR9770916.1 hypothetical protein [Gammaproteobacteria bacterium]MAR71433.1 hypothetical protein [Halomonas sp.]MBY5943455.1 hypothetical protein [Halomonas sp. DP5N14-9]MCJ8285685.1 hypothetical protein [Halomonas sp.]NQY70565.1 hypothetical protein [Halomonas sp.]|tara:strand:+ start:3006 stop:3356 length:351 start_codon:yes stop_codon:yes gene_type:complete